MNNNKLYGAILGDLAGQPYEYKYKGDFSEFNIHNPDSHITDDTIMTLASVDAVLHDIPFAEAYKKWYNLYPNDDYGYGDNFKAWCNDHPEAYITSYGNGCIMRLSPIIYANKSILNSVSCTHYHDDSLKSSYILANWYYLNEVDLLGDYTRNKFCINAFETLQVISNTYYEDIFRTQHFIESIIKKGGDTDTNASIIGELSNHINNDLIKDDIEYVRSKLDNYQLQILDKFNKTF